MNMPDTVDEFLTLCDLELWARERRERPTLDERVQDSDPDMDDYDPSA